MGDGTREAADTPADADDEDVIYRNDVTNMMPLVVVRNEHQTGVALQTIQDDGEVSNSVPVFQDELLPVARALIEAFEAGA